MELTEEQQMLVRSVREMAVERIAPRAREFDTTAEYPWEWIEAFKELGITGLMIPEEYGGLGLNVTTWCLVIEELSKVDGTAAFISSQWPVIAAFFRVSGNEEQKKRYLTQMAQGKLVAICITEPDAGSDVSAIKTRAVLKGDHYLLNGNKTFASTTKVADFMVVIAKVESGEGRGKFTSFIIEKGTPGITIGRIEDKLGLRCHATGELFLEDVQVPVKNRLGAEGEAFKAILQSFKEARIAYGAEAVGIAEGAFEYALNYTKERVQFGKPIAAFQGIQFMLANMATQIEAARCLVYEAASMVDREDENANKLSPMAKLFATDVAMKVTTDAVQLLGGYGYTREHPVERMMRDAKGMQIVEGTSQIQQATIARYLVGKELAG